MNRQGMRFSKEGTRLQTGHHAEGFSSLDPLAQQVKRPMKG